MTLRCQPLAAPARQILSEKGPSPLCSLRDTRPALGLSWRSGQRCGRRQGRPVGFFSSPQAPRCGSAVSWASKRGFVDSLGDPPRLDLLPTWEWGGRGPCWGTYQGAGGPRRSEHSPRARGSALPIPTQAPHEPWSRAHRVPRTASLNSVLMKPPIYLTSPHHQCLL